MTEETQCSVPTESRPTDIEWAERAAERIHLLYRDANYFKSMPKAPLIEGWAEIIRTEFFKSPPVMFGFKTVEDWEKFTKFAASSVLLPVGRNHDFVKFTEGEPRTGPRISSAESLQNSNDERAQDTTSRSDDPSVTPVHMPPAGLPVGRQLEKPIKELEDFLRILRATLEEQADLPSAENDGIKAIIQSGRNRIGLADAALQRIKLAGLPVGESTRKFVDRGESAEQEQNKAVTSSPSGDGFIAPPLSNERSTFSPIECYALDFAAKHHAGQVDKGGCCYLAHLVRVAMAVRCDDPHYFMTGILHDTVEDTSVSLADIAHEFGDELAEAVQSVTRFKHREDYAEYVRRAAKHPIGRVVKLADVHDNLRPERIGELQPDDQTRLRAKYETALKILGELGVGESTRWTDQDLYDAYLRGCEDDSMPEPLDKGTFLASWEDTEDVQ